MLNAPTGQALQGARPKEELNVPGRHGVHEDAPLLLDVPAPHCVGAAEPWGQKEPAGHVALHDAIEVAPRVALYVPGVHAKQRD